jgi:hypothetical protein
MEILRVRDFLMGFLLLGFQKIIPFFILLKLGVLFLIPGFLKIILFRGNFAFIMFTIININYVIILFGISGIYHFTILFFMMSIAGIGNQTFIYFFFYLFFFGRMCLFQQKFLLNRKLIIFRENLSLAFFSFLILSGLPPFFIFFLKRFFLYSIRFSIRDLFILFLVGVISIYIFGFLGRF